MTVMVTGSAGHLGEALMRMLAAERRPARGLDIQPSAYTDVVASIVDRTALGAAMEGASAVLHTATLHKPHVATHPKSAFLETNIAGTLAVLETALACGVRRVVFTSTTSAFGAALSPPPGAPAAWIDERVAAVPKNIYGATKTAAEDLCQLAHREHGLAVVVLRTARFFPEDDDDAGQRAAFAAENAKANEFLYRRVDLEDAARAHLDALDRAEALGFAKFVISAPTPFRREDAAALRADAPAVLARAVPEAAAVYAARGYAMAPSLDRVYDSSAALEALGWRPRYDFAAILAQLAAGRPIGSDLARAVGVKGYHPERAGAVYPFVDTPR